MSVSYYVYYRIDPAATAAARRAAGDLLERVRSASGIQGTIKRKRSEEHLWMEIYPGVRDAAGFEQALAAAFEASGLAAHLVPGKGRHLECFHDD
jgi:hypothetical protein